MQRLLIASWLFMLFLAAPADAQQEKPKVDPSDPATWTWNVPAKVDCPGVEHGSLHSAGMKIDVGYNAYLPPGYADSTQRYPVVYYLHGSGGTEKSDAGFAHLVHGLIAQQQIAPLIVVFPNGGQHSFYFDWPDGKVKAETLLLKELMPHIDGKYRTRQGRDGRALAGFSMGGFGAMRLALKYPDQFGAVATLAGLFGQVPVSAEESKKPLPPGRPAAANTALHFLKQNADKVKGRLALKLVIGDKDFLYDDNQAFVALLKKLDIAHDLTVLPGVEHNLGKYLDDQAEPLLRFLDKQFDKGK